MNVEFEKALKYIDTESYEKAIACLNNAIMQEEDEDDLSAATEYRCVLGELYFRMGMEAQARDELNEVVRYCDETNTLSKQREIAKTFINAMDGILPEAAKPEKPKADQHPKHIPLVPKPVQDKAFITKQMSKKRR